MLEALYSTVSEWGSWSLLALVTVVALLSPEAFNWRKRALKAACVENHPADKRCEGVLTLDSRFGYNKAEVRTLLELLGEKGRRIYGLTELSLDLVYPLAYGLLFAILLVHLFTNRQAWVLLFPLATVTFDLLENVSVATLALTYDGRESSLAGAAAAFTVIKLIFFGLSLLLVIFGALRGLFGGGA